MDGDSFKHIKVTAGEDEDVVIEAGLARESAAPEPARADGSDADRAGEHPGDSASEPRAATAEPTSAAPAEQRAAAAPARKRKPDAYRETTLEDLKPDPMPMAQKVVIIAAVVCIIGALVYYFMFMG